MEKHEPEDPQILIADAIERSGGVSKLARRIGYSRARVYQWIDEGTQHMPPLAAYRYLASERTQ
jgi:transposase-like protein